MTDSHHRRGAAGQHARFVVFASIAVVAVAFAFVPWSWGPAVDVSVVELHVDGGPRTYRLVLHRRESRPRPVVVAFHGTGDSPEAMVEYTGLDRLAARHGFLLVVPSGRGRTWRTVDVGDLDEHADVRFFDRIVADLSRRYEVDRERVYVVGMSDGGRFAQLLAAARPRTVAAVVAHSASRPAALDGLESERHVPIMLVVGADDPAVGAVRADVDDYRAAGGVVEFIEVPGLGHEWSTRHNDAMWRFLSRRSSREGR